MPRIIDYPGTRANPYVTAVCIDCGIEFEKSCRATGKKRCDLCQAETKRLIQAEWVNRRRKNTMPETDRDRYDCKPGKCKHYASCKAALKVDKGCALPCFDDAAPIPVIGWDVSSEFDGISITASVWEVER